MTSVPVRTRDNRWVSDCLPAAEHAPLRGDHAGADIDYVATAPERGHGEKEPLLVLPRGIVLLISALPPPIAKVAVCFWEGRVAAHDRERSGPVLPSRASIRGGPTIRVSRHSTGQNLCAEVLVGHLPRNMPFMMVALAA
jgi:hypothetical protein